MRGIYWVTFSQSTGKRWECLQVMMSSWHVMKPRKAVQSSVSMGRCFWDQQDQLNYRDWTTETNWNRPGGLHVQEWFRATNEINFLSAHFLKNKANLRDLIAATGLVILLKLDLNCRFFSPCDLEIWWMTSKNNRAPVLCYFKLFASFRSHWWIQTEVTVRKPLIWVKINAFWAVWPWNLTDDLQKQ